MLISKRNKINFHETPAVARRVCKRELLKIALTAKLTKKGWSLKVGTTHLS